MNILDKYSEDEFALHNPAFIGFGLYNSISSFSGVNSEGMHVALCFLSVPLSLNRQVSEILPHSHKTPISSWVIDNQGAVSAFNSKLESYAPLVLLALEFLISRDVVSISDNGYLFTTNNKLKKNPAIFQKNNSMKEYLKSSRAVGKWFGYSHSVETIYTHFGVKP